MKKTTKIIGIITTLLLPPVGVLLFNKVNKELEETRKEQQEERKEQNKILKDLIERNLQAINNQEDYIRKLEKENKKLKEGNK